MPDELDTLMDEVKRLRESFENNASYTTEEPQIQIPEKKWYHIADAISRNDELLEAILKAIQALKFPEVPAPPAPPPPPAIPPPEIPPDLLGKMDTLINLTNNMYNTLKEIKDLQEKTLGELEGLYFVNGVKTISKSNTSENLAHKMRTKSILIVADKNNSGILYIGGEDVGPETSTKLNPGESIQLDCDLYKKELYIYGTSGDSVTWVAMSYKTETVLPSLMSGEDR